MAKPSALALGLNVNQACLSLLQIALIADGRAPINLGAHVDGCSDCSRSLERYRLAHQAARNEPIPAYLDMKNVGIAWPSWSTSLMAAGAVACAVVLVPILHHEDGAEQTLKGGETSVLVTLVRNGEVVQDNVPPEQLNAKNGDQMRIRVVGAHTNYVEMRLLGTGAPEVLYRGALDDEHLLPVGLVYNQGHTNTIEITTCDKAPQNAGDDAGCVTNSFTM